VADEWKMYEDGFSEAVALWDSDMVSFINGDTPIAGWFINGKS
jgi:hypothetical protein